MVKKRAWKKRNDPFSPTELVTTPPKTHRGDFFVVFFPLPCL